MILNSCSLVLVIFKICLFFRSILIIICTLFYYYQVYLLNYFCILVYLEFLYLLILLNLNEMYFIQILHTQIIYSIIINFTRCCHKRSFMLFLNLCIYVFITAYSYTINDMINTDSILSMTIWNFTSDPKCLNIAVK